MSRTFRRTLCVLSLTAATAGVATAAPAQAFELAVQDDAVFLLQYWGNRTVELQRAKAMGAKSIRINVAYDKWNGAGRSFQMWQDAVAAARKVGLKVQFTIIPSYYYAANTPANNYLSYKNPKPSRMGAWAGQIAREFKGKVKRYSVMNEPNLATFLTTTGNIKRPGSVTARATLARKMYIAGYNAIKRVDSTNQVMLGEFTSATNAGKDPIGFLKAMTPPGSNIRADGVAHHPFQFYKAPGRPDTRYQGISNTPRFQSVLRDLAKKRALRTPRGGTPPLYFTEFAYLRGGIYAQSEAQRAYWAGLAVRYARSKGVKQLVWYMMADPVACGPNRNLLCLAGQRKVWDSSITSTDGSTVLPTYVSLQRAARSG